MSDKWIRASEIPNYIYCSRAWWLQRVQGIQAHNLQEMERGSQHHQAHGRVVSRSIWARRAALLILFITLAWFVFQFFSA